MHNHLPLATPPNIIHPALKQRTKNEEPDNVPMIHDLFTIYTLIDLAWIALSLFLIGMSKGGFPVGSIAMPLLVLMWPAQAGAARAAVGFMLPLLCLMDMASVSLYRKHVQWKRIRRMIPGSIIGVAIASALFISEQHALMHVTDAALRIAIGGLGLFFVAWHAASAWIRKHLTQAQAPGHAACLGYGAIAGITSSLAHAAGPVMQMVLLPQKLPKREFVATMTGYFLILNSIKMVPFSLMGRIQEHYLQLGLIMLPVIPLGVLSGFFLNRITRPEHFNLLVYCALAVASFFLIVNGIQHL